MDTNILKNSYVIFIVAFITLYMTFYLLGIGYKTEIEDGKPVVKFSWKYPLGLALIVWVYWHFFLYPTTNSSEMKQKLMNGGRNSTDKIKNSPGWQKINMRNWY